jgi:hypothetical protein
MNLKRRCRINSSAFDQLPKTFIEPGLNGRWIFNKEVAIRIEAYRQSVSELDNPVHEFEMYATNAMGNGTLSSAFGPVTAP